jgi:hypothetical protein
MSICDRGDEEYDRKRVYGASSISQNKPMELSIPLVSFLFNTIASPN